MRSVLAIALGLALGYPSVAGAAGPYRLREECTASRCVYYKGAKRQFSVAREPGTKRIVIRDRTGKVRAKIREQGHGSYEVKEPRR